MRLLSLVSLGLVSSLLLTSCGSVNFAAYNSNSSVGKNENPVTPPPGEAVSHSQNFSVPALNQIDVLFVIDNSGSMADEQQILANSFSSFISSFVQKNLDFQIGVISTDVSNANAGKLLSASTSKFLTNSSSNLITQFQNNVKLGTSGSGTEQGLEAMYQALAPSMIGTGGYNAGFIRPGALLSVIFVTDEDECISNGETINQRIARTLGRVQALKGSNYRMDFIINLSAPVTNNVYPSGNLPYPKVYLQLANQLQSNPINVAADFSAPISTLGDSIASQVQSQFALDFTPIAGSILVKINDVVIAEDPVNGWSYRPDSNKVQLYGAALASAPGSTVTITYLHN